MSNEDNYTTLPEVQDIAAILEMANSAKVSSLGFEIAVSDTNAEFMGVIKMSPTAAEYVYYPGVEVTRL